MLKVENAAIIKMTWKDEFRVLEAFSSREPELFQNAVKAVVPSGKSINKFHRYSLLRILTALQLIRPRKNDMTDPQLLSNWSKASLFLL